MSLQKGDIVLVAFLFTDLSGTKLRPGLVLWIGTIGDDVTFKIKYPDNIKTSYN
ncbi:MAG: hypothetical protein V7K41_05225 [Nostoc sp.]|uniref:hypothetical protein n=1 Tax=Nostoc sp. TaxID=1180 RepID=UPI002FFAF8AE